VSWLFPNTPWGEEVKSAHARGKTEQAKAAKARSRAAAIEKQRKIDARKTADQRRRERQVKAARGRVKAARARAADKPRGFFYWE
jgi:hypothetical protein